MYLKVTIQTGSRRGLRAGAECSSLLTVAQGFCILYNGEMLVCSPSALREMDCRIVSVAAWLLVARKEVTK